MSFKLLKDSFITLKVYNLLGKEVSTLIYEEKPAGIYKVNSITNNLPSGIYFYALKVGDYYKA
ncbi:MAG: hypothetical protein COW08_06450, partial [Ignavibacteriales bacterium CG12_big_fil_rev_8_21_14_0_65_30_8]